MYPFRSQLRNLLPSILVFTLFIYVPKLATDVESIGISDDCVACFFQRDGNLPYILRRAVHESGPDENQTFGHCFVCVRCPQNGNENPIPYCRGWWPADPNGGDYEGDGGVINSDETEDWDRIDCISLSSIESQKIKTTIYNYGTKNDYQVINNGGRSCLGYCSDIASVVGLPHELKWNDYTIPGDMRFPTSRWGSDNIEQHPWLAVEETFTVYEQQNTQME